jgi:hypothetical protein
MWRDVLSFDPIANGAQNGADFVERGVEGRSDVTANRCARACGRSVGRAELPVKNAGRAKITTQRRKRVTHVNELMMRFSMQLPFLWRLSWDGDDSICDGQNAHSKIVTNAIEMFFVRPLCFAHTFRFVGAHKIDEFV